MKKLTFKVKYIYNVRNLEKACSITIDTILLSRPKTDIDLKDKVLRGENMEAVVISTRYEDKVNYGLYLTMIGNGSIHAQQDITFTVHENN